MPCLVADGWREAGLDHLVHGEIGVHVDDAGMRVFLQAPDHGKVAHGWSPLFVSVLAGAPERSAAGDGEVPAPGVVVPLDPGQVVCVTTAVADDTRAHVSQDVLG